MALAWLFTRAGQAEAALADRAFRAWPPDSWIVPAIWHVEIGNALLRGERAGLIAASQSAFFLERVGQARVETDRGPRRTGSPRYWRWRTHRLTAYDASYLELALRTGRTLATFHLKLADAARAGGLTVFGDQPWGCFAIRRFCTPATSSDLR